MTAIVAAIAHSNFSSSMKRCVNALQTSSLYRLQGQTREGFWGFKLVRAGKEYFFISKLASVGSSVAFISELPTSA